MTTTNSNILNAENENLGLLNQAEQLANIQLPTAKQLIDDINDLPTIDQLADNDFRADILASVGTEDSVDDEDVSFLSAYCQDGALDASMRKMLMSYWDTTNSSSAEEMYLKNVIINKPNIAELAKRQMEYEQQWKK